MGPLALLSSCTRDRMADEKSATEGKNIRNTVTLLLTRLLGQYNLHALTHHST